MDSYREFPKLVEIDSEAERERGCGWRTLNLCIRAVGKEHVHVQSLPLCSFGAGRAFQPKNHSGGAKRPIDNRLVAMEPLLHELSQARNPSYGEDLPYQTIGRVLRECDGMSLGLY